MKECYHQTCDFSGNPDLNPKYFYFLAKTIQAVTLTVAELSGGLDRCDLTPLKFRTEETEEEKQQMKKKAAAAFRPGNQNAAEKSPTQHGLRDDEADSSPGENSFKEPENELLELGDGDDAAGLKDEEEEEEEKKNIKLKDEGESMQQQEDTPSSSSLLNNSIEDAEEEGEAEEESLKKREIKIQGMPEQQIRETVLNALFKDSSWLTLLSSSFAAMMANKVGGKGRHSLDRLKERADYDVLEVGDNEITSGGGGGDDDEVDRESKVFHGPFQPNYGNQFNIGSMTVNVEGPSLFNGHGDGRGDAHPNQKEEESKTKPFQKQHQRKNHPGRRRNQNNKFRRISSNQQSSASHSNSGATMEEPEQLDRPPRVAVWVPEGGLKNPNPQGKVQTTMLADYLRKLFSLSEGRADAEEDEVEEQPVGRVRKVGTRRRPFKNSPMIIELTHDEN